MEYLIFGILCAVIAVLSVKIYLLQKGLREIDGSLEEILSQDTNRQITLSTRDRSARRLAARLNIHLERLRKSRLRYTKGDRELKEAVTNLSHDLRTPLTAISGYLELLEKESLKKEPFSDKDQGQNPLSADARHCLEIIRGRTEHMKLLTEELFRYSLALSVPEEPPRVLSLNRALEECILSFYESFRKKGIIPAISMPAEPVMRTLDPVALSRILQNVLGNAVKYGSGGLEIRLDEDGTILCSNTAPNLDPLLVEQLFDRYYTVENISSPNAGSSTGLGLSIARLLTERLGGEISAVCRQQPSPADSSSQHPTTENRLEITIRFPA